MEQLERPATIAPWRRLMRFLVPFGVMVLLQLALTFAALQLVSGTRAFTTAESAWSNGARASVLYLKKYLHTRDPYHYANFRKSLQVALDGNAAKAAMDRPEPDWDVAEAHIRDMGIEDQDVRQIARMYRLFGQSPTLAPALAQWEDSVPVINRIRRLGLESRDWALSSESSLSEQMRLDRQASVLRAELQVYSDRFSGEITRLAAFSENTMYALICCSWSLMLVTGLIYARRLVWRVWRVEHQVQRAQDRWRHAVEGVNDALWELDVKTGALTLSGSWYVQLGYEAPAHEAPGPADWLRRVHPEDRVLLLRTCNRLLRSPNQKHPASVETRMRCVDGSWRWILTRAAAVERDSRGRATRLVGTNCDVNGKRLQDNQLMFMAHCDPLTATLNRSTFLARLDSETHCRTRSGQPFALVHLDIDHFRDVNADYGTGVADELLKLIAVRLQGQLGADCVLSRAGGNEFRCLISDPGPGLTARLERLRTSMELPFSIQQMGVHITASIGSACFPADAQDSARLQTLAEIALAAAKAAGGNTHRPYDVSLLERIQREKALLAELRRAVEQRDFSIAYQPIVDTRTGRMVKAEALVRWLHSERGEIQPGEFIALAENHGLIGEISEWVFQQVMRDLPLLRQCLGEDFQVSINKSARQFRQNYAGSNTDWARHLSQSHQGGNVCIEITESLLMDASEEAQLILGTYREAGVEISLDDFGTGYSSLAYLKEFQIDLLKIDRAFVRNLQPDSSELALCEAMIVMGHKLGIRIIAEGVENAMQQRLLCEAGCDYLQGYHFSAPLPLHRLIEWARHQNAGAASPLLAPALSLAACAQVAGASRRLGFFVQESINRQTAGLIGATERPSPA
ncbi:putative bifunctional diguanylate cyclase/phosphodiesterase [Amphibiibacter pelophylacis]|uniref:EAL domain-containing protein n=1 Tax=Amphibiibacter pelophylacis TaxID=1799477 RepID=A0ACC6P0W4_9BURK